MNNFCEQLDATVSALFGGVERPLEVGGQVVAFPPGYEHPSPVFESASSVYNYRPSENERLLIWLGFFLIALALITRR